MGSDFLMSIVRHILTSIGAVLMAKGYVDDATMQAIIGGVVAVVGLGMSYRDKAKRVE